MKWMAERQPPALSPPQIPPRGNQQRAKNWKSPNRPDGVKPAVEFLPENLRRGGRHGQSEAFAGLPKAHKPVTISGNPGDDAMHYQEKAVLLAIEESKP